MEEKEISAVIGVIQHSSEKSEFSENCMLLIRTPELRRALARNDGFYKAASQRIGKIGPELESCSDVTSKVNLIDILQGIFKLTRNALAGNKNTSNALIELIGVSVELLKCLCKLSYVQFEPIIELECIIIQFFVNASVDNDIIKEIVWNSMNSSFIVEANTNKSDLLSFIFAQATGLYNVKLIESILIMVTTCIKNLDRNTLKTRIATALEFSRNGFLTEMLIYFKKELINTADHDECDNTQITLIYVILEEYIKASSFEELYLNLSYDNDGNNSLFSERQYILLQIIDAIVHSTKNNSGDINISDLGEDSLRFLSLNLQKVSELIKYPLSEQTIKYMDVSRYIIGILRTMLRMSSTTFRVSLMNNGLSTTILNLGLFVENHAPRTSLKEMDKTGPVDKTSPFYGFRTSLIEFIGSLVHENQLAQDLARETGLMHFVLRSMGLDGYQPYMKEQSVVTLRFLTDQCAANRELVASLQPTAVSDESKEALASMGLEAQLDDDDGTVRLAKRMR